MINALAGIDNKGEAKIQQLQGLRGLAMLGVFIMHTQTFWSPNGLGRYSDIADIVGRGGVIVFFMLSGFLLIYKRKEIPNVRFIERLKASYYKFHRLRLLYIITLFVAFWGFERIPESITDWLYAIVSLPLCLTYTQDLIPHVGINISYNGPTWYISAMFCIWFLVYSFHKNINRITRCSIRTCKLAILIVLIVQVLYRVVIEYFPTNMVPINHPQIYMSWLSYYSPFYNFGYFIMGCFIGRLTFLSDRCRLPYYGLAILFTICLLYCTRKTLFLTNMAPLIVEIFVGILLLIIMTEKSILKRIFLFGPLVRFGNVSASFFLVHGVVNYHLRYIEAFVNKPMLFFLSFLVSLGLSILSEKYLMLNKDENILQHIKKTA